VSQSSLSCQELGLCGGSGDLHTFVFPQRLKEIAGRRLSEDGSEAQAEDFYQNALDCNDTSEYLSALFELKLQ